MSTEAGYIVSSVDYFLGLGGFFSEGGQTFNASHTDWSLTDIDVCLSTGHDPESVGTIYVKLYAVDGSGHPTGSALSTGSKAATAINQQDGNGLTTWTNFVMSHYTLTAGTTYVLVVSADLVGTPYEGTSVRIWGRAAGGHPGKPVAYRDSTSAWEDSTIIGDIAFRANGTRASGYIDATATITASSSMAATGYADAYAFDPPVPTGLNTMKPIRRLIAVAKNRLWYEDL
jgi:hypothetical protein